MIYCYFSYLIIFLIFFFFLLLFSVDFNGRGSDKVFADFNAIENHINELEKPTLHSNLFGM